jgi:hypothetical protein
MSNRKPLQGLLADIKTLNEEVKAIFDAADERGEETLGNEEMAQVREKNKKIEELEGLAEQLIEQRDAKAGAQRRAEQIERPGGTKTAPGGQRRQNGDQRQQRDADSGHAQRNVEQALQQRHGQRDQDDRGEGSRHQQSDRVARLTTSLQRPARKKGRNGRNGDRAQRELDHRVKVVARDHHDGDQRHHAVHRQ